MCVQIVEYFKKLDTWNVKMHSECQLSDDMFIITKRPHKKHVSSKAEILSAPMQFDVWVSGVVSNCVFSVCLLHLIHTLYTILILQYV